MTEVRTDRNEVVTINATTGKVSYKNERELIDFIFVLKNGIAYAQKEQDKARTNRQYDLMESWIKQYKSVLTFLQRVHEIKFQ